MKILYLVLFISVLGIDGQRRSARTELTENDATPKSVRRGRARFVVPPVEQQVEEQRREPASRRAVFRNRRPEIQLESNNRKNYEVEEIIDDVPLEPFKKTGRPRTFTESRFEAQNASPVSQLFHPSTTENLEEVIRSIGSIAGDTTISSISASPTLSTNFEFSSSELSSSEITKIENEITRSQLESTTQSTTRTTRRTNGRSRSNGAASTTAASSRVRSRVRTVSRRQEEQISTTAPTRTIHRSSRRRPENIDSRSRVPSVIAAAETVELPSRSRTGRKIIATTSRRTTEEPKTPEKISNDLSQSRRNTNRKSVETSTARIRMRSRFRDTPPFIDEQKLEVLPLFERETKTVKPVRKVVSRRRHVNSAEEVETSATENDVKLADKPAVAKPPKETVVVETRTESSYKRRRQTSKPIIKESVVSEITEVTSKRTIIRKTSPRPKTVEPKFVPRGRKKSEINLPEAGKNKSSLSSSEEEIDDSDNYPEHFKALLQAKKQKKESRSQHRLVTTAATVTKTTEKVATSSPSTTSTTQTVSSEANRQLEDSENELDPSTARSARRRLPQSTTEKVTRPPIRKNKVVRSTTAVPVPVRDHRFHAKFNNEPESTSNSVKSTRNLTTKPPRGLYSSRKSKESYPKNKSSTGQISTPKKSNRYSSRYRNDGSSRNAIRTSTNAPAYLPTIPTITPPTTSEYVWPEEENIEYSWSFSRLK